ncbi:hypothetical protein F3Y22_tig00110383pilonHSYRG00406 [Hibiscus syriacus]|uniref:Cyclin C-terminal domain-containing protein n=1 Tax=Hibiscus syriacus TaxID=106335 RepID=A0A6A3AXV1_HIBSY|nr:hypothetical protein F3Y22_tig00110383pilonHSYRG00406 [Hibiscus syriacus]
MLIACKYEEITPPGIDDFCYITDNAYTKEEVFEMEKDVLKLLDFEIGTPTTRNFLRQECCPNVIKLVMRAVQGKCKLGTEHFSISRIAVGIFELLSRGAELAGLWISTILTVGSCFSGYFSFKINNPTKRTSLGKKSIYFVMFVHHKIGCMTVCLVHILSKSLQCHSGYRPIDLKECVLSIHALHRNRKQSYLRAVMEKYTQHKLKGVAVLSSPSEVPECYFEDAVDDCCLGQLDD